MAGFQVGPQGRQEAQLLGKLLRAHLIPVGHVGVDHPQSGHRGGDEAFLFLAARAVEVLDAIGLALEKPGEKASWGGYSGYFQDPDGFLWEVAWNPHISLE